METLQVIISITGITATTWIAISALRQTEKLNLEKSQPYVAVFLERNQKMNGLVDIIIKNFGQTVAINVYIEVSPELQVSSKFPRPPAIPEKILTLVPGQEWRTIWDIDSSVKNEDLPYKYKCKLHYQGLGNKTISNEYFLDWSQFMAGRYLDVRSE